MLARLALPLCALAAAPPAVAQQPCEPRASAVAILNGHFLESVVGRGITIDGRVLIEVWASEVGTMSVTITDVTGRTCLIAAGMGFELLPMPPAGDPL